MAENYYSNQTKPGENDRQDDNMIYAQKIDEPWLLN